MTTSFVTNGNALSLLGTAEQSDEVTAESVIGGFEQEN
jgi:hypothetical protein